MYLASIDNPGEIGRWIPRRRCAVASYGVADRVPWLLGEQRQIPKRRPYKIHATFKYRTAYDSYMCAREKYLRKITATSGRASGIIFYAEKSAERNCNRR